MPVAMRLMRMGTTHHPVYRISIGDSRKRPTAKFIEHIGTYNPTPDKMGHKQVRPNAMDTVRGALGQAIEKREQQS
jgi:small subunit ribosomal protein S16